MKKSIVYLFVFISVLFLICGCAQPSDPEENEETVYLELEAVYESEGYVLDFYVADGYVVSAEDEAGISIFDTTSDTLILRYNEPLFSNIRQVEIDEVTDIMMIYDKYGTRTGVGIYDVSDIKNPGFKFWQSGTSADISDLHITSVDSVGFSFSWVNGEWEYYTGKCKSISNWIPTEQSISYFSEDVVKYCEDSENNLIYGASKQVGMKIYNASDLSEVATISSTGQTIAVKVVDNIAYLGNREEGVELWDISDLANPEKIYEYDTTGLASDISVCSEQNIFAVASTSGGVYLYEGPAGEIQRLQRIDDSEIGYTYRVEIKDGYLYAGTRYGVYKFLIVNI